MLMVHATNNLDLYADIANELEASAAELRATLRMSKLAIGASVKMEVTETVGAALRVEAKEAASGEGEFRLENAAANPACKPAVLTSIAAMVDKLACMFRVSHLANTRVRPTTKHCSSSIVPGAVPVAQWTTLYVSMLQLQSLWSQ
ncbi:hypothetical protein MRX96_052221 [Rhipicephalus microplus]